MPVRNFDEWVLDFCLIDDLFQLCGNRIVDPFLTT